MKRGTLIAGWAILLAVACAGTAKFVMHQNRDYRHAIANLDERAVHPKDVPRALKKNTVRDLRYEDTDGDKYYESVLYRKNSSAGNGEWVPLLMEKGVNGEIVFPTLAETAIDPLHIQGILVDEESNLGGKITQRYFQPTVDYFEVLGIEGLVSIQYIGPTHQPYMVENMNGLPFYTPVQVDTVYTEVDPEIAQYVYSIPVQ